MESIDNVCARFEALAQQKKGMGVPTRPVKRWRYWWRRPWSVAVVAALGLALVLSHAVQAKTFLCDGGDVPCLIDAIEEANANGEANTIRLEAGTYPLQESHNDTDGP